MGKVIGEKSHRDRKNPHMAEKYGALRHETNAIRGKQVWVGGSIKEGGHWERL